MSAQLEDGYTRTANELLEHLMKQRLNGTQHSIIYCVIRNTYGFQRKSHEMSLSYISTATGIHKDLVKRELDKLIEFNVVKVFKEAGFRTTREIGINKDTEEWKVRSEAKRRQSTKQSTVDEKVDRQSTNQSTPTVDESVYQERYSFKDNFKDINTTKEPYLILLDEYCSLHKKIDFHIKRAERDAMNKMISSGMPLEFILTSMKTVYDSKEKEGSPVTSFLYYEKVIPDIWSRSNSFGGPRLVKNAERVNDILGRFAASE